MRANHSGSPAAGCSTAEDGPFCFCPEEHRVAITSEKGSPGIRGGPRRTISMRAGTRFPFNASRSTPVNIQTVKSKVPSPTQHVSKRFYAEARHPEGSSRFSQFGYIEFHDRSPYQRVIRYLSTTIESFIIFMIITGKASVNSRFQGVPAGAVRPMVTASSMPFPGNFLVRTSRRLDIMPSGAGTAGPPSSRRTTAAMSDHRTYPAPATRKTSSTVVSPIHTF